MRSTVYDWDPSLNTDIQSSMEKALSISTGSWKKERTNLCLSRKCTLMISMSKRPVRGVYESLTTQTFQSIARNTSPRTSAACQTRQGKECVIHADCRIRFPPVGKTYALVLSLHTRMYPDLKQCHAMLESTRCREKIRCRRTMLRPFRRCKRPERDRAACTCSKRARWCSRMGTHGSSGRPHHLQFVRDHSHGQRPGKLTVVALLALGAVTRHVAVATARVASLATVLVTTTVSTLTTAVSTLLTTVSALTGFGAVTGNVSDLAALVAFLATTGHSARSSTGGGLGALAGNVTDLTTCVAGFVLLGVLALAAQVALLAAVVASWVSLGWALAGLVSGLTAYGEKYCQQRSWCEAYSFKDSSTLRRTIDCKRIQPAKP